MEAFNLHAIMNKEYKDKFPTWCGNNKKYYMCLTDDLDSLFSCLLLQQIKGYEISHFYSFNALYKGDNYKKDNYKLIGVDMDLVDKSCWGNHVTGVNNPLSANLNVIEGINTNNYFTKYAGSTLLQIISYYDIDISMLSEEAKMVLLCVDSTYLGYYLKQYPQPQRANKKYLCDVLELEELYKLQQEHSKEEFDKLQEKYNLKKKIFVNEEGKLKTAIDLQGLTELFNLPFLLPKNQFTKINDYKDKGVSLYKYESLKKELEKKGTPIFSQAMTNKNYIKLSY